MGSVPSPPREWRNSLWKSFLDEYGRYKWEGHLVARRKNAIIDTMLDYAALKLHCAVLRKRHQTTAMLDIPLIEWFFRIRRGVLRGRVNDGLHHWRYIENDVLAAGTAAHDKDCVLLVQCKWSRRRIPVVHGMRRTAGS